MRHRTCNCRRSLPARKYLGMWACRTCNGLIYARPKPKPKPLPDPEPEMVEKGDALPIAAAVWKADPSVTNDEMYTLLAETLEPEGLAMPAYATWMSGWATEARKLSGTPPLAGRQG